MSKVNVGIYPFDESFVPVIRYKELFDKYRFCLFINHNGNILSEEEIKEKSTYAREYHEIKWDDLDTNSNIDVLLVTSNVELLDCDVALGVIEKYCKKGIEIWLMGVQVTFRKRVKEICSLNNVRCKMQDDIQFENGMIDYRNLKYSLVQQIIETPIVSVAGVVPVAQKYQIQLNLLNNFKKDGYKVVLIGTGELNELMGAYSLGDVLFCRDLPEVHRIHYFNNFLKEIEKRDKPDVIIIGIDDPLLSLSSRHPFNYGIYATELYSAFSPDISIIALMNGNYNDDFMMNLGNCVVLSIILMQVLILYQGMFRYLLLCIGRNFRMHIQVKYKIYQKNTQYFQIVI